MGLCWATLDIWSGIYWATGRGECRTERTVGSLVGSGSDACSQIRAALVHQGMGKSGHRTGIGVIRPDVGLPGPIRVLIRRGSAIDSEKSDPRHGYGNGGQKCQQGPASGVECQHHAVQHRRSGDATDNALWKRGDQGFALAAMGAGWLAGAFAGMK